MTSSCAVHCVRGQKSDPVSTFGCRGGGGLNENEAGFNVNPGLKETRAKTCFR